MTPNSPIDAERRLTRNGESRIVEAMRKSRDKSKRAAVANRRVKKMSAKARLKVTPCKPLGPIEKIHHDLNNENVTEKRYRQAEEFIHACESVALWRIKQGQSPGDASHYLYELVARMAQSIRALTEAGDLMLARHLPSIVEVMRQAEAVFGTKFDNRITKHVSIHELLETTTARELIQMFAALHPDWASLCGIREGARFLKQSEAELRQVLLSEETWIGMKSQAQVDEKRKHRLTQLIEQFQAIREMQQPNINLFVEHLWQGRLWSGPNGTFEDCHWTTRPPRENTTAWMKLIREYLKRATDNDPKKLGVFHQMLASRAFCYAGERFNLEQGTRLTEARPSDMWNHVMGEIRKAWERMEKQARKPLSKNPA